MLAVTGKGGQLNAYHRRPHGISYKSSATHNYRSSMVQVDFKIVDHANKI